MKDLVLKYYPNAKCELRPYGKPYYQIYDGVIMMGQGKTSKAAWTSAYKNYVHD